ncbi:hypothetical protein Cantr_06789 [Candida viswanathii]|uniref:Uncharacterized protein n=1 Tax=Candida viswanathii TaxID=5486 RepID=A0A367XVT5_9ASCO|nr:hypothetical protein Cantr_06789 [Candida viswanathii]
MLKFSTGTLSGSQLKNQFLNEFRDKFPGNVLPLGYKVLLKLDIDYKDLQNSSKFTELGRKLVKFISTELTKIYEQTYDTKTHNTSKLTELLVKILEKLLYTSQDLFKNVNYYNFAKVVAFKALNLGRDTNAKQLLEYLFEVNPNDHLINSILSDSNKDLLPLDELTSKKSIEDIVSVDIDTLIPTKKSTPIKTIVKKQNKVTKKKKNPKFGPNKVLKDEKI